MRTNARAAIGFWAAKAKIACELEWYFRGIAAQSCVHLFWLYLENSAHKMPYAYEISNLCRKIKVHQIITRIVCVISDLQGVHFG